MDVSGREGRGFWVEGEFLDSPPPSLCPFRLTTQTQTTRSFKASKRTGNLHTTPFRHQTSHTMTDEVTYHQELRGYIAELIDPIPDLNIDELLTHAQKLNGYAERIASGGGTEVDTAGRNLQKAVIPLNESISNARNGMQGWMDKWGGGSGQARHERRRSGSRDLDRGNVDSVMEESDGVTDADKELLSWLNQGGKKTLRPRDGCNHTFVWQLLD